MARKPQAQALVTRDGLIDVAERLIEIHGLSRTTLQDIASAAGMTRGAIYHHFKDKQDLVGTILQRRLSRFGKEFLLRDACGPSVEGLLRHAVALFRCVRADEELRRFLEVVLYKVEYVDELAAIRASLILTRAQHVAMIEQCLEMATLPKADIPALALGLHIVIDGLIQNWMLDPSAFDLIKVGQQTVSTYLKGLS